MSVLFVSEQIQIFERELEEQFVRASGPGGQNVNKVATAVELRFDVKSSSLPEWLKSRLLEKSDRRLTQEGVMVISGQRFRTQDRNRMDVRERLMNWVRLASIVQTPRIATKPSRAVKRRRLDEKSGRAQLKKMRGRPRGDD